MKFLPHLATRVLGTPLMLARQKLDVILAVLGSRVGLPDQTIDSFAQPVRAVPHDPQGVAIIPVHGSLVARTGGLDTMSGLTSYGQLSDMLAEANARSDVGKILLHIDSPGGEVNGVFDLAEQIKTSAKPVWAVIDGMGFSAAYLLAAAASRIIVTRTSGVGSIGVIAMHMDQSEKDTKDGVKYTPIFAGDRKNDLSPHEPLANDAAQELQAEVDRLYTMFVTAVATYRGISAEAIRATQARLYWGRNGINANLADDIGTLTSTLEAMSMPTKIKRLMAAEDEISQQDPEEDKKEVVAEVEEPGICPCCGQPLPPTDATDTIEPVEPTEPAATKAAVEIAQMCQLAGFPNQTASFLSSGKSPKQVRSELLRLKAQSQNQGIHSSFTGEARPQQVSPLVTAAQKVASQRMEKRV